MRKTGRRGRTIATLYELTGYFLQLQRMIEEGMDIGDTLESLEFSMAEKLEGYEKVVKNISSDIEGMKAEEKRLNTRRKQMEKEIERLRSNMLDALLTVPTGKDGVHRVKTEKFTFSVRKSKSVEILDETKIPKSFIETTTKINKKAIGDFIKKGGEIVGATIKEKENISVR